jgi:hypothetical protein
MTSTLVQAGLLTVVLFLAPLPQAGPSSSVTIAIECGSQGIVDEDHRVTLTVKNDMTGQERTVTADVRKLTDSEGVCGSLVHALKIGAEHKETKNPRYTGSPQKAQDLCLPAGWQAKKMTVEKRDGSGFHGDDACRATSARRSSPLAVAARSRSQSASAC